MGLLTYGVASGVLRPERLASLRVVSADSFVSPRLSLSPSEPPSAPSLPVMETKERPMTVAPSASEEPPPSAAPSEPAPSEPLAVAAPSEARPGSSAAAERASSPRLAVRPLAGFSLGSPIQDDDGDRGPYAAFADRESDEAPRLAARDHDTDEAPLTASRDHDVEDTPRAAASRRAPEADDASIATNARPRSPVMPVLRERDIAVPVPREFQPAARRAAVALRLPERRERTAGARRDDPDDPYPGFSDDDAPPPKRPEEPREKPREAQEERPSVRPPPARSVSSCEAAAATASDEMDFTKSGRAPDVSRDAYATVLEHGGYLRSCAVPAEMTLDVCAAVRDGRAVGVTVVTHPADARVAACVRNAVAAISFPKSVRLDVTRTHFDRAHAR